MTCTNSVQRRLHGYCTIILDCTAWAHLQELRSASLLPKRQCLYLEEWKRQVIKALCTVKMNLFYTSIQAGSCPAPVAFNSRYDQDLYQFDIIRKRWVYLSSSINAGILPSPRCGLGLAASSAKLFLFGGWDVQGIEIFFRV